MDGGIWLLSESFANQTIASALYEAFFEPRSTSRLHYLTIHVLPYLQNMDCLTQRRKQYLELTNHVLPSLADSRTFPVRYNHCFQRIILDNLFGCCWYEVLERKKPAYKQLTEDQLEQAIALANRIMAEPTSYLQQLNQNSLNWRGKTAKSSA